MVFQVSLRQGILARNLLLNAPCKGFSLRPLRLERVSASGRESGEDLLGSLS